MHLAQVGQPTQCGCERGLARAADQAAEDEGVQRGQRARAQGGGEGGGAGRAHLRSVHVKAAQRREAAAFAEPRGQKRHALVSRVAARYAQLAQQRQRAGAREATQRRPVRQAERPTVSLAQAQLGGRAQLRAPAARAESEQRAECRRACVRVAQRGERRRLVRVGLGLGPGPGPGLGSGFRLEWEGTNHRPAQAARASGEASGGLRLKRVGDLPR